MKAYELVRPPILRPHRLKGQWPQLSDEDVALIEAQRERLERLEPEHHHRVTDPRHQRTAV